MPDELDMAVYFCDEDITWGSKKEKDSQSDED